MDPRSFSPIYNNGPPPGWMGPPGTPSPPPGMGGPPPPGWIPMPFPVGSGPPQMMPMPPPGMTFMPYPSGYPPHFMQPPPRSILPLGAIPPPPAPGPAAPPSILQDNGPPSPSASNTKIATGGNGQFTPRANRTTPSRAQSAGRRTPRSRSPSGAENSPGSPWAGSANSPSFPSSPTVPPGSPGFGRQQNPRNSRGGGGGGGGGGFGSPTAAGRIPPSPASSRPQSGASNRSVKRATSAVPAPRRGGSARPGSAAATFGTSALDESDNIKVVVRVRPLNSSEISRGDATILQISEDDSKQVILTVPASASGAPTSSHWLSSSGAPQSTNRTFPFHSCIGPDAGQDDVMKQCGITQLLDAALDGYNATLLAYGQTGSGKTYTISGRDDDPSLNIPGSNEFSMGDDEGIVSRSLSYIFSQVDARNAALCAGDNNDYSSEPSAAAPSSPSPSPPPLSDGCKYSVRASYSEIYNEALYDLLCFDQRQLSLRWDPVRGFHAPDLKLQDCTSLEEAQEVVSQGLRHRRVGSHALNLESSRSHAILTVHIDAVPIRPEAADFGNTRMGKVVFVDLAGSERLKDSQSEGTAMRETASINRSLFMLGKVISALAAGSKGSVVPYRESKLTKLLMDSLGGSALSLMIACCSPSAAHLEETLSTLSYATRAKNIRNAPAVQMDPQQAAMTALRREVKMLRTENGFLREQLMLAAERGGVIENSAAAAALPPSSASPGASPAALPAHSVMLPVPPPAQEELNRRLTDAQRLLSTLSSENARLAGENERLRAGGLQVAGEYSGAVEEIEWLRSKLARLEVSLMGVSSSTVQPSTVSEAEIDAAAAEMEMVSGEGDSSSNDKMHEISSSQSAVVVAEEEDENKENCSVFPEQAGEP